MKHTEFPKGFLNTKGFALPHASTSIQAVSCKGKNWT